MARVDELLAEYSDHHRDPVNKAIHWLCVPLISLSTVGLLWTAPLPGADRPWANFGLLLLIGALIYYLSLSPRWSLAMAVMCAAIAGTCLLLAHWSISGARIVCAVIFVLSWIAQFLGHRREGKKPAFLRDLQFLLIGPLWLVAALLRR